LEDNLPRFHSILKRHYNILHFIGEIYSVPKKGLTKLRDFKVTVNNIQTKLMESQIYKFPVTQDIKTNKIIFGIMWVQSKVHS